MSATFELHPQLTAETFPVGRLGLSRVLLMNDTRFPWVIVVPERSGLVDLTDLNPADYDLATQEIRRVCLALKELVKPDKLNVAALGNVVPQLHIHVIARFKNDAAWPRPVWGGPPAPPYSAEAAVKRINDLRAALRLSA
jgi:diadenosine tetraphosphate (Ap4A) HIT family hydrolase